MLIDYVLFFETSQGRLFGGLSLFCMCHKATRVTRSNGGPFQVARRGYSGLLHCTTQLCWQIFKRKKLVELIWSESGLENRSRRSWVFFGESTVICPDRTKLKKSLNKSELKFFICRLLAKSLAMVSSSRQIHTCSSSEGFVCLLNHLLVFGIGFDAFKNFKLVGIPLAWWNPCHLEVIHQFEQHFNLKLQPLV